MMDSLQALSQKLAEEIGHGKVKDKKALNARKNKLCKALGLKELPTNADILSRLDKKDKRLLGLLLKKPVRSLSGVAVVAVMSKPHQCPGQCLYCPNSLVESEIPKSYTGKEPATRRAIASNFNPFIQADSRVRQLEEVGHKTDKLDLIVMGGTFPSTPFAYQKSFVKGVLDAVNGRKAESLEEAKAWAEKSRRRVSGICFETRPDYAGEKEINQMLELGGTRVELGVQSVTPGAYERIERGHTVQDVVSATRKLKDAAFKVCYHLMPGLPFTDFEEELARFKSIFTHPDYRPDMLKIYPCLVTRKTKLYELWRQGKYQPLTEEKAVEFIARLKESLPPWVRVMRIQRDIPSDLIEAGVKAGNLRELVQARLKGHGKSCQCIRCREAGLKAYKEKLGERPVKSFREDYTASMGQEVFLSREDRERELLYGFARLRLPYQSFRPEIGEESALLRELHVYSSVVGLGKKAGEGEFQHKGLGKGLLEEAEKVAREEFDKKELIVISGLGVKPYYQRLGYHKKGPYMAKKLL